MALGHVTRQYGERIVKMMVFTQLQDAQEKTNQVRQSAGKLSDKMKQARDALEDDLKDTRDVVTELKDFLAGRVGPSVLLTCFTKL